MERARETRGDLKSGIEANESIMSWLLGSKVRSFLQVAKQNHIDYSVTDNLPFVVSVSSDLTPFRATPWRTCGECFSGEAASTSREFGECGAAASTGRRPACSSFPELMSHARCRSAAQANVHQGWNRNYQILGLRIYGNAGNREHHFFNKCVPRNILA